VVASISGGPGTGKSHVTRCLKKVLKALGLNVLMTATTHAASKQLGEDACTLDAALGLTPGSSLQCFAKMNQRRRPVGGRRHGGR
jgi:hypothetical protein